MSAILKFDFLGDIRRAKVSLTSTLAQIVEIVTNAYGVRVPSLQYTDSDGDQITVVNDSDWRSALEFAAQHGLLRVRVSTDGRPVELDNNNNNNNNNNTSTTTTTTTTASPPSTEDEINQILDRFCAVVSQPEPSDDDLRQLHDAIRTSSVESHPVILLALRTLLRAHPSLLGDSDSTSHATSPTDSLKDRMQQADSASRAASEILLRTRLSASSPGHVAWNHVLLGLFYELVEHSMVKAVPHYANAAAQNNAMAKSLLGCAVESGKGGLTPSLDRARELFRESAELNSVAGITNFARVHVDGQSSATVCELYRKAAARNLPEAMYNLAIAIADENPTEAVTNLTRAANLGLAIAQQELGRAYLEGLWGVDRSAGMATHFLKLAAEQQSHYAEYALGWLYLNGDTDGEVAKSIPDAIEWLTRAANANQKDAAYQLGTMYLYGNDEVTADAETAARFMLIAAGAGHREAQIELGSMYSEGRGVARDDDQASLWFLRATEGNALADSATPSPQDLFSSISHSSNVDLANSVAPSQLPVGDSVATPLDDSNRLRVEQLINERFAGEYHTWMKPITEGSLADDANVTWEPSTHVAISLVNGGAVHVRLGLGDDAHTVTNVVVSESLHTPDGIDLVWDEDGGSAGELSLVSGAESADAVWAEDLSAECRLFAGWIQPINEPRVQFRGFREDRNSLEFRSFVPELWTSTDPAHAPSAVSALTTRHIATLKQSLLDWEQYYVRSALLWEDANQRARWYRAVQSADMAAPLAAFTMELLNQVNPDAVTSTGSLIERIGGPLSLGDVTVRDIASALLEIEIYTPWSAVVPLYRTYRTQWRDTLSLIANESTAEVQQALHTSVAAGGSLYASVAAAPKVLNPELVFDYRTPTYTLNGGLTSGDSLSLRLQLQSVIDEAVLFQVNFFTPSSTAADLIFEMKRPSGDAGVMLLSHGYGCYTEVVVQEGHPFPPVTEDFILKLSLNADNTLAINIASLDISFTSQPIRHIDLSTIDRLQLRAVHGRMLCKSVEHSYTRSSTLSAYYN